MLPDFKRLRGGIGSLRPAGVEPTTSGYTPGLPLVEFCCIFLGEVGSCRAGFATPCYTGRKRNITQGISVAIACSPPKMASIYQRKGNSPFFWVRYKDSRGWKSKVTPFR